MACLICTFKVIGCTTALYNVGIAIYQCFIVTSTTFADNVKNMMLAALILQFIYAAYQILALLCECGKFCGCEELAVICFQKLGQWVGFIFLAVAILHIEIAKAMESEWQYYVFGGIEFFFFFIGLVLGCYIACAVINDVSHGRNVELRFGAQ